MQSPMQSSPNNERARLSTHEKALAVNLDPVHYGTFAEIRAGKVAAFSKWALPPPRFPNPFQPTT